MEQTKQLNGNSNGVYDKTNTYIGQDAIIIDNGSGMIKAGFSGDYQPSVIFPSVCGHPKNSNGVFDKSKTYIGQDVKIKCCSSQVINPIERGLITDWEYMEKIWHHTFYNELKVDPKDHSILLTERPLNPIENKEKMTEIMFETFNSPALAISIQAVLSLYASGRLNGTVLDSGDGITHTVPIYQGRAIPKAILRLDLAGRDLNDFMLTLLNKRDYKFGPLVEDEYASLVKENITYVALDYEKELKLSQSSNILDKSYTLPDGQVITIGSERFTCTEALFQPSLLNLKIKGVHETLYSSIMRCDINISNSLYGNVLLSGGNTLFPGISARMKKELSELAPSKMFINIVLPPELNNAIWIGGSMLASNPETSIWVSNKQYQEYGPSIIHSKCL